MCELLSKRKVSLPLGKTEVVLTVDPTPWTDTNPESGENSSILWVASTGTNLSFPSSVPSLSHLGSRTTRAHRLLSGEKTRRRRDTQVTLDSHGQTTKLSTKDN